MSRMRATVLLAAALAFAGGAFDSPSLYVPAIGLALLAAVAAAWVGLAARGASAQRAAGEWSVLEGEPYRLRVQLTPGRVPAPGGLLVDPLLPSPLALGPRFGGLLESQTSFGRRGRNELPPLTLQIRDPFGLRVASRRGAPGPEVLVLPRTEPVKVPGLGAELSRQGGEGQSRGDDAGLDAEAVDFEIDGLRPYRPGSPASRIHWRSVARSAELVEHRLVSGGGSDPLVVLDSRNPVDRDALDRAVRAAASLCLHLGKRGGCVLLLPSEGRPRRLDRGMRAWPDLHARLALVEPSRRPPALRARRSRSIYWVSASADAGADAVRAGLTSGYLVTPGDPRRADAFSVAGCRGRDLSRERGRDRGLEAVA